MGTGKLVGKHDRVTCKGIAYHLDLGGGGGGDIGESSKGKLQYLYRLYMPQKSDLSAARVWSCPFIWLSTGFCYFQKEMVTEHISLLL